MSATKEELRQVLAEILENWPASFGHSLRERAHALLYGKQPPRTIKEFQEAFQLYAPKDGLPGFEKELEISISLDGDMHVRWGETWIPSRDSYDW